MATCNNGTYIPTDNDPIECNGKYTGAKCTLFTSSITYLNLPANSSLETVMNAVIASLSDARNRIGILESENAQLTTRVEILENE